MRHIDIAQARAKLEELVDQAAAGESMVITKDGVDIARLVGFKSRRIGMLKGQFEFDEKASAEMDKKIEALFTESERLPKQ
jgi:prevent-host-death family protein